MRFTWLALAPAVLTLCGGCGDDESFTTAQMPTGSAGQNTSGAAQAGGSAGASAGQAGSAGSGGGQAGSGAGAGASGAGSAGASGAAAGVGGAGAGGSAAGSSGSSGQSGAAGISGSSGQSGAGGDGGASGDGGAGGAAGGGGAGGAACVALPITGVWENTGVQLPVGPLSWQLFSTGEGLIAVDDQRHFWRLDGGAFTELTIASPPEMKGSMGVLVRDEARKEFLLIGNYEVDQTTGVGTYHADTWALSLQDGSWKARCAPCGFSPVVRAVSYDSDRERVVLVTTDSDATGLGIPSTSEWDGSAWTNTCGQGKAACPFGNSSVLSQTYDRARQATTMVALTMGNKNVVETWTYDASLPESMRWKLHPSTPSAHPYFAPLEYDETRQRVAQKTGSYGGHEWDGACWIFVEDPNDQLKRTTSSIVHVPAENRTLALGYFDLSPQGDPLYFLLARQD